MTMSAVVWGIPDKTGELDDDQNDDDCCGHTAIFLLHKLSKTSKWLTILAHNLIFQYDRTFAAQNFHSINTLKSFVFGKNSAEFYAQFYRINT